jgi:hypothetical protein
MLANALFSADLVSKEAAENALESYVEVSGLLGQTACIINKNTAICMHHQQEHCNLHASATRTLQSACISNKNTAICMPQQQEHCESKPVQPPCGSCGCCGRRVSCWLVTGGLLLLCLA